LNIILVIHHYLDPNTGAAGAAYQRSLEYKKLGHKAEVYSFKNLPEWMPGKVKSVLFPYFAAGYIIQSIRKQRIDVVEALNGDTWLWGMLKWKLYGPLSVTHTQGLEHTFHKELLEEARRGNVRLSWMDLLYFGGVRLWEEATSLRRADLVLFLNRYDLNYAVKELGVKPERARIVANGIPGNFLNLPFGATPVAQDALIRVAQVGSYIPRKGIKYTAPALNAVLTRHPQVQATFLGTGYSADQVLADYDPSVRTRIKVVSRYTRAELPTLLEGHHIKLFSSLAEGFSLGLVEAMACGLAPVVTATPGALEIAQDAHDALIVPARDSQAIEQALERLIIDRSLLDRLRRNAHSKAQLYSWSRIAQQTLDLHEEFVQKRGTGK